MRQNNRYLNLTVTNHIGTRRLTISKKAVTLYESCDDGKTVIRADGQRFFVDQSYDVVKEMMEESSRDPWNIVSEVGNPKKPGLYPVTLIYREVENGEETGRKCAVIDSRYFAPASEDAEGWAMDDQDTTQPAYWVEETGSYFGENVYAWKNFDDSDFPPLPDDIVIKEG